MSETEVGTSGLLAPDALSGVQIALSASESPDLPRLGLLDIHFRLALAETARSVLVGGGRLAYGGHLNADGYTAFMIRELHRYSRRDRPLTVCLAWSEHRRMALASLTKQEEELGLFGEIICLDPNGEVVAFDAGRGADADNNIESAIVEQSLTSMRKHLAAKCHGLLVLGGKREGFQGQLPGVLEEVLMFMEQGKPVYPAAGFGGTIFELIKIIDPQTAQWFPALQNGAVPDAKFTTALKRVETTVANRGWAALKNGLSDDDNRRLATTHRPSEIAALISLGLGRNFSKDKKT